MVDLEKASDLATEGKMGRREFMQISLASRVAAHLIRSIRR